MSTRSVRTLAVLACAVVVAGIRAGGVNAAHVARLDIQPAQVAPGELVTVFGPPGWAPTPVTITWNALDGPVLGTFQTTTGGNASFGPGTVTVPADARPGIYTLFGNQEVPEAQTAVRGVPARALVTVVSPGGTPPVPAAGTPAVQTLESLEESGGPSTAGLVLLGVGAFVVTLGAGVVLGLAGQRKQSALQSSKA